MNPNFQKRGLVNYINPSKTPPGFHSFLLSSSPSQVPLHFVGVTKVKRDLGAAYPEGIAKLQGGKVRVCTIFCASLSETFFNFTFDKGRLKSLVSWTLDNYGEYKTVELLEQLKKTGFEYATNAGISLGIEDLKIPPKKALLLLEAEQLTRLTVHQYQRGDITAVERFKRLIDTWHRTSEQLKQEVISYFEETDILNPVYMMAFSGARGNISQVRQLVGMRGLMSDPKGQIIDFPIRSNFREGLTLTEYIISSYGSRKGIVDTALRTANAGYLTRRLVDVAQHVIISHYDCGTQKGLFLTDMKEGNKTILSLQNRLIGRVLARDIYKKDSTELQNSVNLANPIPSKNEGEINVIRTKSLSLPPAQRGLAKPLGSSGAGAKAPGKEGIKGELAKRNQEISSNLAVEIARATNRVFVRSSLTCNTTKLVCQLCYGWSLAQGKLVSVGETVGVIAAQSIGEPGTQLTMRTFHTGGVFSGDVSDEIRAPFDGFVEYTHSIPGTLIRTLDGKIAFLTKSDGTLILQKKANNIISGAYQSHVEEGIKMGDPDVKKYKIPAYTILFIRNGADVFKKQVVAQITNVSTQPNMLDTAEYTIQSELEGLFYAKNLDLQKKIIGPKPKLAGELKNVILIDQKAMKIDLKSRDWNFAWVLSGKRYELPFFAPLFPTIGDYITTKTIMTQNNWMPSNVNYKIKSIFVPHKYFKETTPKKRVVGTLNNPPLFTERSSYPLPFVPQVKKGNAWEAPFYPKGQGQKPQPLWGIGGKGDLAKGTGPGARGLGYQSAKKKGEKQIKKEVLGLNIQKITYNKLGYFFIGAGVNKKQSSLHIKKIGSNTVLALRQKKCKNIFLTPVSLKQNKSSLLKPRKNLEYLLEWRSSPTVEEMTYTSIVAQDLSLVKAQMLIPSRIEGVQQKFKSYLVDAGAPSLRRGVKPPLHHVPLHFVSWGCYPFGISESPGNFVCLGPGALQTSFVAPETKFVKPLAPGNTGTKPGISFVTAGSNSGTIFSKKNQKCLVFSNYKKNKLTLNIDFSKALFSKTLNQVVNSQDPKVFSFKQREAAAKKYYSVMNIKTKKALNVFFEFLNLTRKVEMTNQRFVGLNTSYPPLVDQGFSLRSRAQNPPAPFGYCLSQRDNHYVDGVGQGGKGVGNTVIGAHSKQILKHFKCTLISPFPLSNQLGKEEVPLINFVEGSAVRGFSPSPLFLPRIYEGGCNFVADAKAPAPYGVKSPLNILSPNGVLISKKRITKKVEKKTLAERSSVKKRLGLLLMPGTGNIPKVQSKKAIILSDLAQNKSISFLGIKAKLAKNQGGIISPLLHLPSTQTSLISSKLLLRKVFHNTFIPLRGISASKQNKKTKGKAPKPTPFYYSPSSRSLNPKGAGALPLKVTKETGPGTKKFKARAKKINSYSKTLLLNNHHYLSMLNYFNKKQQSSSTPPLFLLPPPSPKYPNIPFGAPQAELRSLHLWGSNYGPGVKRDTQRGSELRWVRGGGESELAKERSLSLNFITKLKVKVWQLNFNFMLMKKISKVILTAKKKPQTSHLLLPGPNRTSLPFGRYELPTTNILGYSALNPFAPYGVKTPLRIPFGDNYGPGVKRGLGRLNQKRVKEGGRVLGMTSGVIYKTTAKLNKKGYTVPGEFLCNDILFDKNIVYAKYVQINEILKITNMINNLTPFKKWIKNANARFLKKNTFINTKCCSHPGADSKSSSPKSLFTIPNGGIDTLSPLRQLSQRDKQSPSPFAPYGVKTPLPFGHTPYGGKGVKRDTQGGLAKAPAPFSSVGGLGQGGKGIYCWGTMCRGKAEGLGLLPLTLRSNPLPTMPLWAGAVAPAPLGKHFPCTPFAPYEVKRGKGDKQKPQSPKPPLGVKGYKDFGYKKPAPTFASKSSLSKAKKKHYPFNKYLFFQKVDETNYDNSNNYKKLLIEKTNKHKKEKPYSIGLNRDLNMCVQNSSANTFYVSTKNGIRKGIRSWVQVVFSLPSQKNSYFYSGFYPFAPYGVKTPLPFGHTPYGGKGVKRDTQRGWGAGASVNEQSGLAVSLQAIKFLNKQNKSLNLLPKTPSSDLVIHNLEKKGVLVTKVTQKNARNRVKSSTKQNLSVKKLREIDFSPLKMLINSQKSKKSSVFLKKNQTKILSSIQPFFLDFKFKTPWYTFTESILAPVPTLKLKEPSLNIFLSYSLLVPQLSPQTTTNFSGEANFNLLSKKPLKGVATTNYISNFKGEFLYTRPYKKYIDENPYKDLKTGLEAFNTTFNKRQTLDEKVREAMFQYYLQKNKEIPFLKTLTNTAVDINQDVVETKSAVSQIKESVSTRTYPLPPKPPTGARGFCPWPLVKRGILASKSKWSRFNLIITKKDIISLNYKTFNDVTQHPLHNFIPPKLPPGVTPPTEVKRVKGLGRSFIPSALTPLGVRVKGDLEQGKIPAKRNSTYINKAFLTTLSYANPNASYGHSFLFTNTKAISIKLPFVNKEIQFNKINNLKGSFSQEAPARQWLRALGGKLVKQPVKIKFKNVNSGQISVFSGRWSTLEIRKWVVLKQKNYLVKNNVGTFFFKGNPFLLKHPTLFNYLLSAGRTENTKIGQGTEKRTRIKSEYIKALCFNTLSVAGAVLPLFLPRIYEGGGNFGADAKAPLRSPFGDNSGHTKFVCYPKAISQSPWPLVKIKERSLKSESKETASKNAPFPQVIKQLNVGYLEIKPHWHKMKYMAHTMHANLTDTLIKEAFLLISGQKLDWERNKHPLETKSRNRLASEIIKKYFVIQDKKYSKKPKPISPSALGVKRGLGVRVKFFTSLFQPIMHKIHADKKVLQHNFQQYCQRLQNLAFTPFYPVRGGGPYGHAIKGAITRAKNGLTTMKDDVIFYTKPVIKKSGQLIHMNKQIITLRLGQPIVISPRSIIHTYHGDFVRFKTPVITLTYQQLKTGDIVQGIPKIEQLFEARTTKRGRLFRDNLTNLLTGLFLKYYVKSSYLLKKDRFRQNSTVILAMALKWSVKQSFYKIQQIIVDGILRVYRSQGVSISDKHVEIIVKQMTSKVRIINSNSTKFNEYVFSLNTVNRQVITNLANQKIVKEKGVNSKSPESLIPLRGISESAELKKEKVAKIKGSKKPKATEVANNFDNLLVETLIENNLEGPAGLFPGEIVDLDFVENINRFLLKTGEQGFPTGGWLDSTSFTVEPIKYEPIVLGITRASLEVESFLSAASFQQTTRVLSQAALYKKKDFLKGLKENILIGNLIPAGTGYLSSLEI